jgi:hypothetical protein
LGQRRPLQKPGGAYTWTTGAPLEGARLEIRGLVAGLSGEDGSFHFPNLRTGRHVLRVEAFGHQPDSIVIQFVRDTTVELRLRPQVFDVAPIEVGQRRVSVSGRITDAETRLGVSATVSVLPGTRQTRTNGTGRYALRNVAAADSAAVVVEAFGYMPRDTLIGTDAAANVSLAMQVDPIIERRIAQQLQRLNARTSALRYRVD